MFSLLGYKKFSSHQKSHSQRKLSLCSHRLLMFLLDFAGEPNSSESNSTKLVTTSFFLSKCKTNPTCFHLIRSSARRLILVLRSRNKIVDFF